MRSLRTPPPTPHPHPQQIKKSRLPLALCPTPPNRPTPEPPDRQTLGGGSPPPPNRRRPSPPSPSSAKSPTPRPNPRLFFFSSSNLRPWRRGARIDSAPSGWVSLRRNTHQEVQASASRPSPKAPTELDLKRGTLGLHRGANHHNWICPLSLVN